MKQNPQFCLNIYLHLLRLPCTGKVPGGGKYFCRVAKARDFSWIYRPGQRFQAAKDYSVIWFISSRLLAARFPLLVTMPTLD